MYKPKLIILAWLLLLVPTLLLGVGALRLLQSEETRLLNSARSAAGDRVEAIAGNIDLAVAEVQDGLLETLRQLPQDNLPLQLDSWKRENPLVRNVFIWQRGRGLIFPNPEQPASDEEEAFVRRYLPLFADQTSWHEPLRDLHTEPLTQTPAPFKAILSERRELRQLAKQTPTVASRSDRYDSAVSAPAAESERQVEVQTASVSGQTGWRSWYSDDQLHLLGWFSPDDGEKRYGVEVEMMALFSRLLGNLSQQPEGNESYALLDGNGGVFYQVGPFEVLPESSPLSITTIASLPHWQVGAYTDPVAGNSGSGILLIGSLLIGTFIIAILLGGSLLLWQAYRNHRDAAQKISFVSNVSHELKTPLTTIRMYAELLGEGSIKDKEKQQRYLHTIIKESQRLTRLVGNVLDFSRLEQGRRSYQRSKLNLNQMLHELTEQLLPRLSEVDMVLEMNLPDNPIELYSDRDALEQIILNLFDNGIKYAASGKKLQLDLERHGNEIWLCLQDWGPGVPHDQKEKIFDKFHRVDNSLTTRQQGSGLGLSIARQLAEGLGGSLNYCSIAGSGCCIELHLPATGCNRERIDAEDYYFSCRR